MSALCAVPGTGQAVPEQAPECGICGVPHYRPCAILARYVQHLRQAGHGAGTVKARRAALGRLADALPVAVLDADAAMLAAWRASLAVSLRAVANYARYVAAFYAFALAQGLRGDDPAAGLCRPTGRTPSGVVLPAEIGRYLDYLRLRGHSAATIYDRKRAMIRMTAALGVPLPEATAAGLMAWRAGLAVSDDTAVHYVSHAREVFGWLQAEGLRPDNPAARLPSPKLGRRLPRPISEPDLMRALDLAGPRIRLMLVLAAYCGLRAKELAYLRRESVMETGSPPMLLVTAEATKGRYERWIPLSSFVVAEIGRARLPASGYVFRRHDGRGGPNSPGLISHLCNEHLHATGTGATLHSLRHFFGTGTYAAGKDLRVTQELLGHQSPATTAIYAAWSSEGARAAVEALPVPGRLAVVR